MIRNLFLLPWLALFSCSAWANQCVQLFEVKNKLTISNLTSTPTEEQIQLQISALVEQFYKIQTKDFANEDQLKQSVAHFNNKLKYLIAIDIKYKRIFEQHYSATIQKMKEEKHKAETKEKEEIAEKERIIFETTDSVTLSKKISFHEIEPVKFLMGEANKKQVKTEITIPFALMDTQVTQMMWARFMIALGEKDLERINPSHFKTGEESTLVKDIDGSGIDVEMKPDHPVDKISWNDVKKLTGALNLLSNSVSPKIQEFLKKMLPGHQNGDHYDLPSEAQIEYAMKMAVTSDGDNIDAMIARNDIEKLKKYVVFSANSNLEIGTSAVASKLSLYLNGQPIYLYGNLLEWTNDSWNGTSKLPGGKDPLGKTGTERALRGGSWCSLAQHLLSGSREFYGPNLRFNFFGFRLVRTRP